ncbi:MAG TPA: LEA type 2 family protein [Burkholderiaceae bacterium]|nr:LEA type 2 family protein [Burkholderiaceae bacterium]
MTTRNRIGARASGLGLALLLVLLGACATIGDALRVNVVGVEPLQGEGLELRFAVRLRVQNPNDGAIEFDGVAVDLELDGKNVATGVSDQKGSVPRFGETIITVPVTVSAFNVARVLVGFSGAQSRGEIPYAVSGKLAGGSFGAVRFSRSGTLALPQPASGAAPSGG